MKNIEYHERQLTRRLEDKLRNMDFVVVYGPEAEEKVGIILFNIEGISSEDVTAILSSRYGICVRGGYHCAGLAHKTIGTWDRGAVRVSFGPFNTLKEINALADAVWRIGKGHRL